MSAYTSAYAELAVTTNFSFLRGASHPREMVARADELGLAAIGIADRNSFAGVVRAYGEARKRNIKLLVGTRLVTADGFEVLAYPADRAAYGRLCQLLTKGNLKAEKGECHLTFADILGASEGQIFIALPPPTLFQIPLIPAKAGIQNWVPAYVGTSGESHFHLAPLRPCRRGAGPHVPRRRALSSRRRTAPARAPGRTWRARWHAARRRQ